MKKFLIFFLLFTSNVVLSQIGSIGVGGAKTLKVQDLNNALRSCAHANSYVDSVELNSILTLDCSNRNFVDKSLNGIGDIKNLEELNLSHNILLTDVSVLYGLNNLHTLDLSFNTNLNLTNYSWLARFQILKLTNMGITDLPNFTKSTSLEEIYLNDNNLSSALSKLPTSLQVLDISNNLLTSCSNLSGKTVKSLKLAGNSLNSLNDCNLINGLEEMTVKNTPNLLGEFNIDSVGGYCSLSISNTSYTSITGSRPILILNVQDNDFLETVDLIKTKSNTSQNKYPDLMPQNVLYRGNPNLLCSDYHSDKELWDTHFTTYMDKPISTTSNGITLTSPICTSSIYTGFLNTDSCKPDELVSITAIHDNNTQRTLVSWEKDINHDYTLWGITKFKVTAYNRGGTIIEELDVPIADGLSVFSTAVDVAKYSVSACIIDKCGYEIETQQISYSGNAINSFDVYEDVNTQRRFITWEKNESYDFSLWGVTSFEIKGFENGVEVFRRPAVLDAIPLIISNSIAVDRYSISTCSNNGCNSVRYATVFSQGLSRVVDTSVVWNTNVANAYTYQFKFHYPQTIFDSEFGKPDRFIITPDFTQPAGHITELVIPVGNFNNNNPDLYWHSIEIPEYNVNDNNTFLGTNFTIKACSDALGCGVGKSVVLGNPITDGDIQSPLLTGVNIPAGKHKEIQLTWGGSVLNEKITGTDTYLVDYIEVTETQPVISTSAEYIGSLNVSYNNPNEQDITFYIDRGGNIPFKTTEILKRIVKGRYTYSIKACHRDRVGGDKCSQPSQATLSVLLQRGDKNTIPAKPWEIAFVNYTKSDGSQERNLAWSFHSSGSNVPDYYHVHSNFGYVGIYTSCGNLNKGDFIVENLQYNVYQTTPIAANPPANPPPNYPSHTPHAMTAAAKVCTELRSRGGGPQPDDAWIVKGCYYGVGCGDSISILDTTETFGNLDYTQTSQASMSSTTVGGPGDLNPGTWWNPALSGTGWHFYWASDLRNESTHEDYGKSYDLIAVWYAYALVGGEWTPVWIYSEMILKQGESFFEGHLKFFNKESNGDISSRSIGRLQVHFDVSNNDLITLNIELNDDNGLLTQITESPSNANNCLDTSTCLSIDSSTGNLNMPLINWEETILGDPIFGEDENNIDHYSGIWMDSNNTSIYDSDFSFMVDIEKNLEWAGLLFYDDSGLPIWAVANSCHSGTQPATCDVTNDTAYQYQYYTMKTGFNPLLYTPNGYWDGDGKAIVIGNKAENGRTFYNGTGTDTNFRDSEVWIDVSVGNKYSCNSNNNVCMPGRTHGASLQKGASSNPIHVTKTASLHDIRFFINGNDESVTTCDPNDSATAPNGECVVKFTWYTDDDFPSIEPFYKRGSGPYLPLSDLCGNAIPTTDVFVVTDYQCTITIPGTYTFQLRKDNYDTGVKDVVIAQSQEMTIQDCNVASCVAEPIVLDAPSPATHTLVQDASSSKVGFTSGALNVSMDGSASYSVPIFTPVGTGGMKPSLSLVYNSNDSSNNLLGVGWNIGGISSISRCLKNKEQDGIAIEDYQPITLTNSDAFCLDGQKLKLLSGNNGENDSQYKTEVESFSKITINEVQNNAPSIFEVYLKNGEIRQYGKVATHNAQILADNTTTPITWLLNKISDRNGNEIWFNWNNNNSEKLLETVEYTRRGANPDFQNQIVFNYEDRDDDKLSYSLNNSLSQLKRLKSITTQRKELTNSTGFTVIRKLNLDYQYSALSHNSQIHSITSCADSSSINCLEPVVFDWSSQLSDMGFSNKLTSQSILDFTEYMGTSKTIDINGDGRKEIIFPRLHNNGSGTNPEIRFFTVGNSNYIDLQDNGATCGSSGGYFNKSCNQSIQPTEAEDHTITGNDYYVYDFNGDGKEDLLSPVLDNGGNNSQWTISYSNGKQLCTQTSGAVDCINQLNTGIEWFENPSAYSFNDFTGDGLPDLLHFDTFTVDSENFVFFPADGKVYINHPNQVNTSKVLETDSYVNVAIENGHMPVAMEDIYCPDNNSIFGDWAPCEEIVYGYDNQNPMELPEVTELVSITPLANDFNGDGLADVLISYRHLFHELACAGGDRKIKGVDYLSPTGGTIDLRLKDSDCYYQWWAVYTYEPTGSVGGRFRFLQTIGMGASNGNSELYLSDDGGLTVHEYINPYLNLGNSEQIQVMDFNGDGLADVVTEKGVLINNGQGFNDIIDFARESDGDYNYTGSYTYTEKRNDFKYLTQFIDYDYDGDLDILYAEPESSDDYVRYRYRTLEYDATTGYFFSSKEDTQIVARSKDAEAATVIHIFDDFNGDSYPDHLYVKRVPGDEKFTEFSNGAWKARDKIVKITKTSENSLKDETKISYESSTLPTVYTRTYDGFSQDWGNGSAVFDILAPNMYLVRQISTLSPTKTSATNESSIFYHYKGLKVQGGGRGSLGFSEMSTVDVQNKVSTQTTYRQDFPFTGSPEATMKNHHPSINSVLDNDFSCTVGLANCSYSQCSGSSCRDPLVTGTTTNALSDAVNEYEEVSPASDAGTHFVFLKKSIEDFYELDKPDVILKTIVSEMNYANKTTPSSFYGDVSTNSTKVCSSYTNGVCSVVTSSEISNQYNNSINNINKWILGRLSSSTSTQSRLNEVTASPAYLTITNTSSFTYDEDTGQILTEISGTGSDQYMQTKHIYDTYGNETDTLLCSQSIVDADNCTTSYLPNVKAVNQLDIYRHSKNVYDSEWHLYVNQTQSLFGAVGTQATMQTTNQVLSRDIFGNITEAKDLLNNITGESVYGLFGELQASMTDTGTYSQSINQWCTSTICPNNAALVTISSGAGMPTSKEYKDAQGRVVRVQGQSRAGISNRGAWTTTDSWYDESGRAKQTTVPYFMSATPTIYLSTNTYDDLGRVIATSSPNHAGTATTSTIYDGLEVTHFNAKNQKKVSYMDETGKTIQIDQFLNDPNVVYSSILYYYGANDKLVKMNSNGAVTTMEYDNLGRKTSMVDPDKGNWSYTYLPTGDMQTQTDGLGQIISFSYDVQGRLIEKTGSLLINTDQEINNKWYYDESGNFGKLTREISITHTQTAQEGTEKVIKHYTYDSFGRPSQVITQVWDGDNGDNMVQYTQKSTYDEYSRAFQNIDATGYGTMMVYDDYGFQYMTMEAAQCDDQLSPSCQTYYDSNSLNAKFRVYYEAVNIDQFGNVIKDQYHNGSLTTIRNYNQKDGIMENTCIDSSPDEECTNSGLQDKLVLGFDKLGNLTSKQSTAGTETFIYDTLNRLKTESRALSGNSTSASYDYTENGNLTLKAGEILTYDATQPHAVSSFKGTNFSYDANGNMIASTLGDFRRTINYTGLSKAYKIKNDNTNKTNYFIYDTNHSRIVRKDSDANMRTKLTHYIGNVEMIQSASNGNIKTYKRYIGALIIDMPSKNAVQGNWKFNYQFKDHIGSSHSIITLNALGTQEQDDNMSFDAWGQRRFVNNFNVADINLGDVQFSGLIDKTTKGFTGHEHLDETGIIHMNGRIYTAYTGRFLQADPLIQDPFDTQSLNRYTYVSNNPLSLSDPTGYFSVDAFMQSWGVPLIQLGIVMAAPYLGMNTIVAGALSGAVSGGTKGALIGAFTAYAFQGVGDYYSDLGAASSTGKVLNSGLSAGQFAGKVAMHGLVGGISTLAQGGKFGHGFASAGVTQVSSPAIGKLGGAGFSPTRVFVAAIVGGTVSQLTGGKFANGAVTGAFSRAFNHEGHLEEDENNEGNKQFQMGIFMIDAAVGPAGGSVGFVALVEPLSTEDLFGNNANLYIFSFEGAAGGLGITPVSATTVLGIGVFHAESPMDFVGSSYSLDISVAGGGAGARLNGFGNASITTGMFGMPTGIDVDYGYFVASQYGVDASVSLGWSTSQLQSVSKIKWFKNSNMNNLISNLQNSNE